MCSPSKFALKTYKDVTLKKIPKIHASRHVWSIWKSCMFKWPSQKDQSLNVPSPIGYCNKLAASIPCTSTKIRFIQVAFLGRNSFTVVMFYKHLFRLNYTFTQLCLPRANWFATWACEVHIWYKFNYFTSRECFHDDKSHSNGFNNTIIQMHIASFVSNATLYKVMCLVIPIPWSSCTPSLKCVSLRITNAQSSSSFTFFPFLHSLFFVL